MSMNTSSSSPSQIYAPLGCALQIHTKENQVEGGGGGGGEASDVELH